MSKRNLRFLAFFGTAIMLMAVIGVAAGGQPAASSGEAIVPLGPESKSAEGSAAGVYIVQLVDPPVASYQGGISGLEATNPAARGEVKLDSSSEASVAYENYLQGEQAEFLASAEAAVGRDIEVQFTYQHAYNGLALVLSPKEAATVSDIEGVAYVQPEFIRYPQTDYGPQWIGAEGIWDGSSTGGLPGTKGEGVIIGVIDTGMNLDHPSFADVGGDGYDHTNPWGSGNYSGLCDSEPGTWVCNDKLIGYWIFTGETTEDNDGHGSHTSSTAAGNVLITRTVDLTPYNYSPPISGVAPHANVIGYDACIPASCPIAALTASIDQAVIDGVDVINYSIGGDTSNPWTDSDALAFLAAQDAGIIPVTSAGNDGPGPSTVGSPADAPWVLTVGASTHNRAGINVITNMTGGALTPPADISGKGFSAGHGPATIVYAGDFGDDGRCLNPFPVNTWTNDEIVVCDRGTIARVGKGFNVLQGGAGGYVLANADAGQSLNGDVHHLPAVHITYDDGVVLKAWLDTGSGHTATIAGTNVSFDPANGDLMAGFSSRGPLINTASEVIKPDVTAPGVDILAAYRSNPPDANNPTSEYGVISGTSMSSPMTAGAAALMRALYPGWSAAEIKSAMMSTGATAGVVKEDGVTPADPFDFGGGRVELTGAGQAGLVLDVPAGDFQAANPAGGGDPSTLNLASMANNDCDGTCSWTRTVSSTLSTSQEWDAILDMPTGMAGTVTPSNFTLAAGGSQELTIEIDSSGLPAGVWSFAELGLDPVAPPAPPENGSLIGPAPAHLPIAVYLIQTDPAVISVDPVSVSAIVDPNTAATESLTISNVGDSDLDWSIFEQVSNAPELVDWSDDFDSYATGSQMHGQGGWKGWAFDIAAGALTSSAFAHSAPNSVEILNDSDLVHEYSGYTSGLWTYTAWQYIPDDFSGESYFILLNQYSDGGANNWSTQVHFESATGLVIADGVGSTFPALTMVTGQWVELRVVIDLDNDNQMFYYDDQLLYSGSWEDGVSGSGEAAIGAVDLFAFGASSIFYDDISLMETCSASGDIPWISVSPSSGTTSSGTSDNVDINFNSTGFGPGSYQGTLCVESNDPASPIVPVPVSMTVQKYYVHLPLLVMP